MFLICKQIRDPQVVMILGRESAQFLRIFTGSPVPESLRNTAVTHLKQGTYKHGHCMTTYKMKQNTSPPSNIITEKCKHKLNMYPYKTDEKL